MEKFHGRMSNSPHYESSHVSLRVCFCVFVSARAAVPESSACSYSVPFTQSSTGKASESQPFAEPRHKNKLATHYSPSLEWSLHWVVVLPCHHSLVHWFRLSTEVASMHLKRMTASFVCNNVTQLFTTPEARVVVSGWYTTGGVLTQKLTKN